MARIIKGMEPNKITTEKGPQNLQTNRKSTVDLRRRKRRMEEEPHAKPEEPATKEGRESKEMVIVYPNVVILRADDLDDLLSEHLVGEHIGLPEPAIKAASPRRWQQIVKERPQKLLTKPMVELLEDIRREESRETFESIKEGLGEVVVVAGVNGGVGAEGADVKDLHVVGEAITELEKEGLFVPGKGPAASVGAAAGTNRKLIGDDDNAILGEGRGSIGRDAVSAVLIFELGDRARGRHDTGEAAWAGGPGGGEGGEVPSGEIDEVGVGSGHHVG